MPAKVTRSWNGDELSMRIERATGRAAIGIAAQIVNDTKRLTHKVSGTLARSVHAAPVGYDGSGDQAELEEGPNVDLFLGKLPHAVEVMTPLGAAVEVGSWLPYACVEWFGRKHPGLKDAVDGVAGARATRVVQRAFREEGLL